MHPRTIYISVFLGALLLVIVRLFGEVSVARLLDVQKSVDFRQGAVIQLERLVSDCKDIQRGTRGFAASGDPRFLELSERGLRSAQTNVQDLRRKFTSRPAELALLGRIEQGLERITAHGRDTLMAPRKAQHLGALTYDDQLLIDALGTDVVMLQQKEAAGIAADEKAAREWSAQSTLLRTAGAVLVAAVLIGAFFTMRREIIQRTLAERTTASANEALKVQVAEGTRRSGEMELLNELSELLQVSTSLEETRDMFAVYGRHLFPGVNGAVYTHKPSRNALDLAAFWGEEPAAKVLALDDCWALRRGRVHATGTEEQSLVCGHSGARAASLCIPMLAHGEAVGVLHLNAASADLLAGPTARCTKRRQTAGTTS